MICKKFFKKINNKMNQKEEKIKLKIKIDNIKMINIIRIKKKKDQGLDQNQNKEKINIKTTINTIVAELTIIIIIYKKSFIYINNISSISQILNLF
jgi:hypothetical protein